MPPSYDGHMFSRNLELLDSSFLDSFAGMQLVKTLQILDRDTLRLPPQQNWSRIRRILSPRVQRACSNHLTEIDREISSLMLSINPEAVIDLEGKVMQLVSRTPGGELLREFGIGRICWSIAASGGGTDRTPDSDLLALFAMIARWIATYETVEMMISARTREKSFHEAMANAGRHRSHALRFKWISQSVARQQFIAAYGPEIGSMASDQFSQIASSVTLARLPDYANTPSKIVISDLLKSCSLRAGSRQGTIFSTLIHANEPSLLPFIEYDRGYLPAAADVLNFYPYIPIQRFLASRLGKEAASDSFECACQAILDSMSTEIGYRPLPRGSQVQSGEDVHQIDFGCIEGGTLLLGEAKSHSRARNASQETERFAKEVNNKKGRGQALVRLDAARSAGAKILAPQSSFDGILLEQLDTTSFVVSLHDYAGQVRSPEALLAGSASGSNTAILDIADLALLAETLSGAAEFSQYLTLRNIALQHARAQPIDELDILAWFMEDRKEMSVTVHQRQSTPRIRYHIRGRTAPVFVYGASHRAVSKEGWRHVVATLPRLPSPGEGQS